VLRRVDAELRFREGKAWECFEVLQRARESCLGERRRERGGVEEGEGLRELPFVSLLIRSKVRKGEEGIDGLTSLGLMQLPIQEGVRRFV
jgi:hypothetical protein